jgi:hypothetical protein
MPMLNQPAIVGASATCCVDSPEGMPDRRNFLLAESQSTHYSRFIPNRSKRSLIEMNARIIFGPLWIAFLS